MDRFQGYLIDSRSLNGFLRRNDLDILVRSSKSFLPYGFESCNEGRLISLYSCPHVITKSPVDQGCDVVENTGAVLRFDKPKTSDFQIIPFLSRLEDDDNDNHDFSGSQVFS